MVRFFVILFASFLIGTSAEEDELTQLPPQSPERPLAPRLVDDLAGRVEDRKALPADDPSDPPEEYQAYCLTLRTTKETSEVAFANRALLGVTYVDLYEESERYRGEVIRLQGRLKRISEKSAPKCVRDEIPVIYECAIFDLRRYGANPLFVRVIELPHGLHPGDYTEVTVTLDAYFFKRFRYTAGNGLRDAPLLIGRTLTVDPSTLPSRRNDHAFTREFVAACLLLIGATLGVLVGLTWWYRRGDRRVRAVLAARRRLPDFENTPRVPDVSNGPPEWLKETGDHE